jgi:hypothetical protein
MEGRGEQNGHNETRCLHHDFAEQHQFSFRWRAMHPRRFRALLRPAQGSAIHAQQTRGAARHQAFHPSGQCAFHRGKIQYLEEFMQCGGRR